MMPDAGLTERCCPPDEEAPGRRARADVIIERISPRNAGDVAMLHEKYLDQGFLSSLGNSFLKLLYRSMVDADTSICLVAVTAGGREIAGFISGSADVRGFYKHFLSQAFFPASAALLPHLLRPRTIGRIIETLLYPVKTARGLPEAELLSIAVKDDCRKRGIGEGLFNALVREFHGMGVTQFKVIVGSELGAANAFYRKMGCSMHSETEVHRGKKSEVYIWNT